MSLVSIAIVGKDNEPLYLREFISTTSSSNHNNNNNNNTEPVETVPEETETSTQQQDEEGEEEEKSSKEDDPFGFLAHDAALIGTSVGGGGSSAGGVDLGREASLRHQFILHASLDLFEEVTSPTVGNRWRTPGATGSDAMWVGLLAPIEDLRIYGYLTNTHIKMIGVIEDTADGMGDTTAGLRESELRSLFANLHELYVEHVLNPFTKLKSKIVSKRFDAGVSQLVHAFNGGMGWA